MRGVPKGFGRKSRGSGNGSCDRGARGAGAGGDDLGLRHRPVRGVQSRVVARGDPVLDRRGHALYFSRATIPWARDAFARTRASLPAALPIYRHYGLYAYRPSFLRAYAQLEPSPLESFEALEQLRALWHGYRIAVVVTQSAPAPGVDTPEDLERVRAAFAAKA